MNAQELMPHLGVWPTGPGPLQHKLARGLVDAIRKGAVHPGIRLPSERSLAQALSISRTTVVGEKGPSIRSSSSHMTGPSRNTRIAALSDRHTGASGTGQKL